MVTVYKLTDENMRTHGGYQWALNEERTASGTGNLCGPGWLHAYQHPLLAVLHNPVHADFRRPRLFRARAGGKVLRDGQMKLGAQSLTLLSEMPLPVVTTEQRVRYAILCARAVIGDRCPPWSEWADAWLAGTRDATAAWAAAGAAVSAEAAAEAGKPLNLLRLARKACRGGC